ncbi:hypothetical protein DFQ26_009512 [Actinomortierella ambigua]|nr:hypothetical protein DFQ26_009512 [Actinomortierella ambigua]
MYIMYIEAAFNSGFTEEDKSILSTLCPPVTSALKSTIDTSDEMEVEQELGKDDIEEEDEEEDEDEDENDNNEDTASPDAPYKSFYHILFAYVYNRKRLASTLYGRNVQHLIGRAAELGIVLPVQRQWSKILAFL